MDTQLSSLVGKGIRFTPWRCSPGPTQHVTAAGFNLQDIAEGVIVNDPSINSVVANYSHYRPVDVALEGVQGTIISYTADTYAERVEIFDLSPTVEEILNGYTID